jgi:uncharacterized protein (TIGR00266 family)
MRHEILYRPSYSLLTLDLEAGEALLAETGAMVSMSANVQIETAMRGGFLGALKRSVLGGESFFVNTFTATGGPGEVTMAPSLPGDVSHHRLGGGTIYLQSGAYLCGAASLQIDSTWGGAKGFFGGPGLVLLKINGTGDLFFSSYGALHPVTLAPGQEYLVDTGHLVAFEEGVQYEIRKAGNWKSAILGGEGLVCHCVGPGRLYLQSRNEEAFLKWLLPKLPKPSAPSSGG